MKVDLATALSKPYIDATVDAANIGKDKLGSEFYASTITRLLKNGFWASIETRDGRKFRLRVKYDGRLTIINEFKEVKA